MNDELQAHGGPAIENLFAERRTFPPDPAFVAQANATAALYDEAGADYVGFWERQAKERAAKVLTAAKKQADQANVACDTLSGKAFTPYEGIAAAAKKKKCDVIFMASHGRRGLSALLMGSVTQKVLVHSKIPVLVYR